ncbi:cyclohexadienyl dehydratase [Variovorax sp. GrIS 2.14]|uniref:ABC transporter substrate-binding protein n=1 Tax=Variovorax sp. GrIS 2.14 TaxID=3071709 RepID=UPI0038F64BB5
MAALSWSGAVQAGGVADRVRTSGTLRVCIWTDYYGITYRNPRNKQLGGVDIDLSAAFARRLGVDLAYVESSFPRLIDDLVAEHCDIAMHGVGITPQRQAALRFSQPYLSSDIYGVTTRSSRLVRSWEDIDRPGVKVAVQSGTFMEPVMRDALKQATLVSILPPLTREQELEAGRVDVFMTDYPYSRRLLDNADWARLVAPPQPFHRVPYAYAVKPDDDEWLRTVDAFVADIKRDGLLGRAAAKYGLGEIVVKP